MTRAKRRMDSCGRSGQTHKRHAHTLLRGGTARKLSASTWRKTLTISQTTANTKATRSCLAKQWSQTHVHKFKCQKPFKRVRTTCARQSGPVFGPAQTYMHMVQKVYTAACLPAPAGRSKSGMVSLEAKVCQTLGQEKSLGMFVTVTNI